MGISVKSRVFKLERVEEYNNAIDNLIDHGFIHACSVPLIYEKEISKYPLEYFYTSFQTEVAFKVSRIYQSGKSDIPNNFHIDDMTYAEKDKLSALYPKASPVLLSDLFHPEKETK